MANAALLFVVVVWISNMLFGWLIEANQLTILKGIRNFFFLLYHLCHVYAFFTYAQVKYPLGFPLIMINTHTHTHIYIYIYIYFKEVLYLLNDIYIYVEGHVAELAHVHIQSVWGLREKRFKLQKSGKKGSSYGVSSIL